MPEFDDDKRLASLRKSIQDMSDDELYELIGQSRNNRAYVEPKKKRKSKKKESSKKVSSHDLLKQIKGLDPEKTAALLKKLKGNA